MGKALIVSSAEQTSATLAGLLKREASTAVQCVASGGKARRLALEASFELVVVNAPLQDEFGDELAVALAAKLGASAILIVTAEVAEEVAARVENDGVLVLAKPISKVLFFQTVKLAAVARRQLVQMQRENERLQNRIEELRMVDRAKCALIQYRGMTEPEAHHYIERMAMDERTGKRAVAKQILDIFE